MTLRFLLQKWLHRDYREIVSVLAPVQINIIIIIPFFFMLQVSPAKRLRGGVFFVDEVPKNDSGKILRRELKMMLPKPKSKL